VGALHERNDIDKIFDAIADPGKFVVIQAAPAVRASISECFNYPIGSETEGKLAAALRALGFDRVFDTTFGADLTVMEEAAEFISRMQNGGVLPMTTSCCPAWVKCCEQEFPNLLPNISSCKSPHQMCGAVVKSYLAEKEGIAKENIVVVSAMPCTAKKFELTRKNEAGAGVPDVDFAITTRELGRMIERAEIPFLALSKEKFDSPLGFGSGAGTIFGASGGVMEAALRTAADWLANEELQNVVYTAVRGLGGVKEATYTIAGKDVKVAVVSGLANAKALMEKIAAGEVQYSFIEVMACPGGCVNGGGQPQQPADIRTVVDIRSQRANTLYALDEKASIRKAHANPEIKKIYSAFLGKAGSKKAHELLHTTYVKR
jgi:NADP-reducing hydrogenase subunit HndD